MNNVIQFPTQVSEKGLYDNITKKYESLIDIKFEENFNKLRKNFPRFDAERMRNLCLVKKMLVKSLSGIKKIQLGMGNVLPNVCTVTAIGEHFEVKDKEMYKDMMMLCSCCDAHALMDGSLEFDYTLYNMEAKIDDGQMRMLFENIFGAGVLL